MIRFFNFLFRELTRAIVIPLFLFAGLAVALAFTEPTAAPTGGTVYAPVNTGGTAQTKSGNFTSSGTVTGNILNAITQVSSPQYCIGASCITSWPSGGGVSQIIAGTNVTISPTSGVGAVTINASGGSGSQNLQQVTALGYTTTYPLESVSSTAHLMVGADSSTQRLFIDYSAASGFASIQGGAWGGTTRPIALQGGGGNVGIGTISPIEKLHVNGNSYVSGLGKFGDLNAVNNGLGFWGTPQGVLIGSSNGMMVGIGMAGNGSVGIGVSNGFTPYGTAGWNSVDGNFYVSAYGRNLVLNTDVGRSVVVSQGNLGVGTVYPSQKLEVAGNIKAGRFYMGDNQYGTNVPGIGTEGTNVGVATNGVFAVTNGGSGYQPVYASDYWINNAGRWASSFSDVRLKKNIQPLTNILGKLQNIQSVSFNWNDAYAALGHPNDARQIGVIAQELETQFPELVTATSTDGYKSVNYEGLTAVLLEAVKEQQKEIGSLKARLDALEAR